MSELICRTCLEEIIESNFIRLDDESNNATIKLSLCVPEMDLKAVPNACICIYCANLLQTAYDFKLRCLNTEKKIREHKNSDLSQIKERIKGITELDVDNGMEVLYIEDADATIENDNAVVYVNNEGATSNELVKSFLGVEERINNSEMKPRVNVNGKLQSAVKLKKGVKKNKILKSRNKKLFTCTICKFETAMEKKFRKHVSFCKSSELSNGIDIIKSENSKCTKCNFKCKSEVNLHLHCRKPHTFICDSCSYATTTLYFLKKHEKLSHSLDGAKFKFVCKNCSFATSSIREYEVHSRKHKTEKMFSCMYCSFRASVKTHVKKHEIERHPKKVRSKKL